MVKIKFETGQTVNFQGNPTQKDINEVASKLKIKAPTKPAEPEKGIGQRAAQFLGIEKFGQRIGSPLVGLTKEGRDLEKLRKEGKISDEEAKDITTGGVSNREAVAGAVRTGLVLASGGAATAKTGLGRIAASTGEGAAFGATTALESAETAGEAAKDVATGGAFGLGAGIFGEGVRQGIQKLPKFLSYTSDTPETALRRSLERPSQVVRARGKTPTQTLASTRKIVTNLRTSLSQQYDDGAEFLVKEFQGKRARLSPKAQKLLLRVVDDFGIDTPQNLNNMSVKESLGLLKNVNELFSKKAVRESASGIIVRKAKSTVKSEIIKQFGGNKGAVDMFFKNYSIEKTVFDSADDLAKAFATGKTKAAATAEGALQAAFDDNKSAYLSALQDLEMASGKSILDEIAAQATSPILPKKSGKFGLDEIFRAALLPVTSPRLAGFETRSLGRMVNTSRKLGLTQPLKVMLLDMMIKPEPKK